MGMHTDGSSHSRHQPGAMRLTIAEIMMATKNFSPSLMIGQGGSGTVYKAQLADGTVVAVKRAKKVYGVDMMFLLVSCLSRFRLILNLGCDTL